MINLKGLSLFSSAGIAETYFERNGVFIKVASELQAKRVALYRHLYPNAKVFNCDLTNPEAYDEVIQEAKSQKCDFILATPPCQGMSKAGLKKKSDPRNQLILVVMRAILDLKPKFVIIENVPEILNAHIEHSGRKLSVPDLLESELGHLYHFNSRKIVNAMNYGVAQTRERCVFLLARKDLTSLWEFPAPSEQIKTMRDVIGDLPSIDPYITDVTDDVRHSIFPEFENKRIKGASISPWHCPPRHVFRHVIAMIHTPEGCSAMNNQTYFPALKDGRKTKGFNNTYRRQYWDKPAFTITQYTSRIGSQQNGHPGHPIVDSENETERIWSDPRTMTIFEIMRLMSLPDDWNIPLDASHNLIREVLGEGVPPKLLECALIELNNIYDPDFHSQN